MKLLDVLETLVLDVRGQRVEFVYPGYVDGVENFKRLHRMQPDFEYEAIMAALFERILDAIDRPQVLDLGAYIGYYTVLASKHLGARGRVWAIESNPSHIETLRQIVQLNHLENVEPVHAALSDKRESLRSVNEEVSTDTTGSGVIVQAETCDALCQRLGITPNVAKMDVHGFEGKVLGGMREVLNGPLQYLLLELHPNFYLEKFTPGITRAQILNTLEASAFHSYVIAGHRGASTDMVSHSKAGRFIYQPLTRDTRRLLLFDRHNHTFVLASKRPLEELVGPSAEDLSVA